MAELVGEDVGLREVAGRAKLAMQLVEEPEIEIDLAVGRTVERAGRRLREAAGGVDRVAEQHRLGVLIAAAEQLPPRVLRVVHDRVDHVDELLFLGRGLDLARGADRFRRRGSRRRRRPSTSGRCRSPNSRPAGAAARRRRGLPRPCAIPPERPRASSMLLRSPAVHLMVRILRLGSCKRSARSSRGAVRPSARRQHCCRARRQTGV